MGKNEGGFEDAGCANVVLTLPPSQRNVFEQSGPPAYPINVGVGNTSCMKSTPMVFDAPGGNTVIPDASELITPLETVSKFRPRRKRLAQGTVPVWVSMTTLPESVSTPETVPLAVKIVIVSPRAEPKPTTNNPLQTTRVNFTTDSDIVPLMRSLQVRTIEQCAAHDFNV